MNLFDRIARRVSEWQAALHRVRILPLVRADFIVMLLFAGVAIVAGSASVEAMRSSRLPEAVTLKRIFSPQPMGNRHVEVEVHVFPETGLFFPPPFKGFQRPVEFAYVAMIDDEGEEVLLARFAGDLAHGAPRHATITGMLQAPDSLVSRQLDAAHWKLAGLPVERRYVLVAGMTPKPLWLFAPICFATGGVALALFLAMFRRARPDTLPTPGA